MVEGLIRARLEAEGQAGETRVRSAGVRAYAGFPATETGVALLAARGIDISTHQSRLLTERLLADADLVLVMEEAHRRAVLHLAPQHLHKVHLLTELAGRDDDVADPVGGSRDDYRRTLAELDALLDAGWPTLLRLLRNPTIR